MSLDNIAHSLSPSTQLFDRQIREKRWARTLGTEDITSTAICLIALHRYGAGYAQQIVDVDRTFEALIARYRAGGYSGALGLLLWANAVWEFSSFEDMLDRLSTRSDELQQRIQFLTTMEVAWLLSGLLHTRKNADSGDAGELACACEEALLARYSGESRLFWHASADAGLKHRLRRGVANFADQIYPVHALAMASMLNGGGLPCSSAAMSCADRLCSLQGDMGQWWWHYNPGNGEVLQRYPVYSVHQYGMAPMALMSAQLACGRSFAHEMRKSIGWISVNEAETSLIDYSVGTVWRNIDDSVSRAGVLLRSIRNFSGRISPPGGHRRPLEVNFETRPYEWGWLLYAFAVAMRRPGPGHIV